MDCLIKKEIIDSWSNIKYNVLIWKQRIFSRIEQKETYLSYIKEYEGIKLINKKTSNDKFIKWYKNVITSEVRKEIENRMKDSNEDFNDKFIKWYNNVIITSEVKDVTTSEVKKEIENRMKNSNEDFNDKFIKWYNNVITNEVKKEISLQNKIDKY
jgi:hypothetical protein